jgi:hypothetical protein
MERVTKKVYTSVEEYLEDLPKLKKERLNGSL